jgi:long-chain acyl-CoA synthetase
MTETAAATSITGVADVNMGHCGPPLPCCEVKLRDIPEMKYLHTDPNPRGEILVRGPNVFAGYYKNDQATKETIEADGWIATGDVGRWNANGTLSIIDRKKNLFKLAHGEYIAAEKVEGIYQKSQAVGQVWIYGNSTKSAVVAVIVPNVDTLRNWAESMGWWKLAKEAWRTGTGYAPAFTAEIDELCTGPHAKEVKAFIVAEMNKMNGELNSLEKCKDIIIESKMDERAWGFHELNDTLTPTNKLKRPVLLAKYINQLKALYAANGEPTQANEKWPGEQ